MIDVVTLQTRIEQRAKDALLQHLYTLTEALIIVQNGLPYDCFQLPFSVKRYKDDDYNSSHYWYKTDKAADQLIEKMLPDWIKKETDSLLQKLDSIEQYFEE